ncbi:hypothetical protein [Aestuariivirga sp.]|uniref:hypothetical protein n=1 Tax=Aestuariivirga sp. TaxID=2650926 RepID=UPI0039E4817C
MQEAIIHLPMFDNDGKPIGAIHDWLKRELCKLFGGFTSHHATGGWIDPTDEGKVYVEQVRRYIVAASPDFAERNEKLKALAYEAGLRARQVAVYWRDFNGTVSIDYIAPEDLMPTMPNA